MTGSDPVEILRRWSDAGALWRVLAHQHDRLTVGLYRCDGGEEIDRFSSSDPALLDYVGDRRSSED